MASDGCGDGEPFKGFSLSLALPDEAAARRAFDALAVGGKVETPLNKTFWSPCFGMLTDKFGLGWMITIEA
jgi:PhnB protein